MTFRISTFRLRLLAASALAFTFTSAAQAAEVADVAEAASVSEVVVTMAKTTRSAVEIGAVEAQKILPGVNPLKAIETLPGVLYVTADPWGNNEQNLSLFVHGFSTQQLGYTLDGVPLGDQQYGNYNSLSPSRAITSENVERVNLSSGAGALGVASTSNLGGAIETYSRDPSAERVVNVRETVGSYRTTRTFLRFDTGDFAGGNSAYISYLHHDARAWDFNGHQRGDQVNLKYVHDDARGKFTAYIDWQSKFEPNEDATAFGTAQTAAAAGFTPYTRPFYYPDRAACTSSLTGGPGTPPAAQGNNFSNCFSAAQRQDILAYVKYDLKLASDIAWSNQVYYHYDYGRGIVAGPINQAGLPGLFATYYPQLVVGTPTSAATLQNIVNLFGGSGNEVRTTEYRINRGGVISTLVWDIGDHKIEAGGWLEHNEPAQHRAWYPFTEANNDLTPYDEPRGQKAFTQYYAQFYVNDIQLHIQDQWRILPSLLLQAGVKSSLQDATGKFLINQKNLPTVAVPVHYPSGSITSNEWFLPQVGLLWEPTEHEQVFANVQKNLRQFIPYGAGSNFYGFSPWSLGTQAAFELFKSTVSPETSWTYELGARTRRELSAGPITSVEGQVSVYHVKFRNRLLNIAPFNFINPGPAILANVGGVTTDGLDVAATLNFGEHFHAYDALSYSKAKYDSNYNSGTILIGGVSTPVVIATGGKRVPLTPAWQNKFILGTDYGAFSGQISGDYVGKRYVTYLNDLSVKSTFMLALQASYRFTLPDGGRLKAAKVSVNVTNLNDIKGVSTAVVTGNSGGYQGFPIPPRMAFVTLDASF